jgi:uncharacterized protein Yka (UPF0111/DUF47 family)
LQDQLAQLQDEYTQLDSECAALRNMVEERNTFITSIKSEIYRKEYKNDTQRVDLHQQLFQKESIIKKLEVCVVKRERGGERERERGREG